MRQFPGVPSVQERKKDIIVCGPWKKTNFESKQKQNSNGMALVHACAVFSTSISFCFSLICNVFALERRWLQRGGSFAHDTTKCQKILCWPGWCFVGRQGPCSSVISSILCSSTALHTASVATDVFFVSVRNGAISEYGYNLFVCSIVNLQTALPLL